MRPLIVGEANPHSADPEDAMLPYPPGSAGARLCAMLGAGEDAYLTCFDRANLFPLPPARWLIAQARTSAQKLAQSYDGDIIMLGTRVSAAFGFYELPVWERHERFVRLPHPSGRSREWNEEGARERLRSALGPYLTPQDHEAG